MKKKNSTATWYVSCAVAAAFAPSQVPVARCAADDETLCRGQLINQGAWNFGCWPGKFARSVGEGKQSARKPSALDWTVAAAGWSFRGERIWGAGGEPLDEERMEEWRGGSQTGAEWADWKETDVPASSREQKGSSLFALIKMLRLGRREGKSVGDLVAKGSPVSGWCVGGRAVWPGRESKLRYMVALRAGYSGTEVVT